VRERLRAVVRRRDGERVRADSGGALVSWAADCLFGVVGVRRDNFGVLSS
jgi:hypothetical protein